MDFLTGEKGLKRNSCPEHCDKIHPELGLKWTAVIYMLYEMGKSIPKLRLGPYDKYERCKTKVKCDDRQHHRFKVLRKKQYTSQKICILKVSLV